MSDKNKLKKFAIYNSHNNNHNNHNNRSIKLDKLIAMKNKIQDEIKEKQNGIRKFEKKKWKHLKHLDKVFLEKIWDKEIKEVKQLEKELNKINNDIIILNKKELSVDDITNIFKHLTIKFGSKINKTSKRKTSKRKHSKRKHSKRKTSKRNPKYY